MMLPSNSVFPSSLSISSFQKTNSLFTELESDGEPCVSSPRISLRIWNRDGSVRHLVDPNGKVRESRDPLWIRNSKDEREFVGPAPVAVGRGFFVPVGNYG